MLSFLLYDSFVKDSTPLHRALFMHKPSVEALTFLSTSNSDLLLLKWKQGIENIKTFLQVSINVIVKENTYPTISNVQLQ
jgi:hypothetical protein